MIAGALDALAGLAGVDVAQAGVVALLLALALYARRAIGVAALVGGWVRSFALVAVVLALLLAGGVIDGFNVGALLDAGRTAVELVARW